MRKGWIVGSILAVSLMFLGNAGAQFLGEETHLGYQPQDFSARIYGMGGLSTAGARGAEAVFSNPAGMALDIGSTEILLTSRAYLFGKPPQYEEDYYEDFRGWKDYSLNYGFHPNLSNFSAYGPYRERDLGLDFAGGVALRRYYDWGMRGTESYKAAGVEHEWEGSSAGVLNFLTVAGAVCYQEM